MHLRKSTVNPSGRLAQFKPNSVPKIKPLPTVWNRTNSRTSRSNVSAKRSKSLDSRPKSSQHTKIVHFANDLQGAADQSQEESTEQYLISHKPSAIYRFNSIQFLNSLRNFRQSATLGHETELSRHYRMSKDILDSFVRLKSAQFDDLFGGERSRPTNGFPEASPKRESSTTVMSERSGSNYVESSTSPTGQMKELAAKKKQPTTPVVTSIFRKKPMTRPKSASVHGRRSRLASSAASKSTSKLNRANGTEAHSDEEQLNGVNGADEEESDIESLEPFYHRSLDKISSIANWERQIRYELEIEKELQRRELDRQKEKIQHDQRKLEEWDKHLRIELDARERKIRLGEEEIRSRYEEFTQKSSELMRREHMINDIVTERIKTEMKLEIEKLRKKFNELELDKNNLSKKEERVKEVEARLHEQVKIVKEKIDSKRLSDIELAKFKKELEIVRKENEVFKEKVDSMEDYQVTKYENRSMKNELHMVKEALDSKNQELERDRERWEKEQRACDQKVASLRGELRKAEQELVIQKQKAQGDLDEMTSKYEAVNGQLKRLQAFINDHLAKLNSDFSTAAQSLNVHYKSASIGSPFMGNKTMPVHHVRHHSSSHHLHRLSRTGHGHNSKHQRSVSMDGHDYASARATKGWSPFLRSPARGCRLCDDEEDCELEGEVIDQNGFILEPSQRGGNVLIDYGDIDEEDTEKKDLSGSEQELAHSSKQEEAVGVIGARGEHNSNDDEVVQKIVNKIYEKMSQVQNMTSTAMESTPMKQGQVNSDTLLMTRLLSSISDREITPSSSPAKSGNPQATSTATTSIRNVRDTTAQSTSSFAFTNSMAASQVATKQPTKDQKPISSFNHEDFDADTIEELPNYRPSVSKVQQHRSLYEELIASEAGAGSSTGGLSNGIRQTERTILSSESNAPLPGAVRLQAGANVHSIQNDNNNNHVLSKKPVANQTEPVVTTVRTTASTAPKENHESRSSSAAESRSDSKSESFEIDW